MPHFTSAGDIRTAVIGYGSAFTMGRHHLSVMKSLGMQPAAVAELDPQRRRAAEVDFPGIATYASAADMLRKSRANLITIVTPHHTHARLALQCLRAGRHVICEKPMAITTAECDRMIGEAQTRGLMITTFHNRHWDGCVAQAVRTIGRGAIGKVHRVEARRCTYGHPGSWWRSSRRISGGILYDWGAHFVEYALQIIDAPIKSICGFSHCGQWADQTPWNEDANEDEASAVVRFANGAWFSLTISQIDAKPNLDWFQITGTGGSYLFQHDNWQLVRPQGKTTVTTCGRNPPSRWDQFHRNILDHLVKGQPLIITPQWSRRAIHILDLAGRSAATGRTFKARYT